MSEEKVAIFDPKVIARLFEMADPQPEADGTCRWWGPYGVWSTKPYVRDGRIFKPYRPCIYKSDDGELMWNVPEICLFFGLPETAENKAAISRTLDMIAMAAGSKMRVISRSDA